MTAKSRVFALCIALVMLLGIVGGCTTSAPEESAAPQSPEASAEAPEETAAVEVPASASLQDGVYTGEGAGNNGTIKVEVTVSDGSMSDIAVADHVETPGLGDVAMDKISAKVLETGSVNVDAVAGATMSSNGFLTAVTAALKEAGATDEMLSAGEKVSTASVADQDEYTVDVVVVGAGGAGLSAAVEAAGEGASVALLEKTSAPGGNTLVSGGGMNVPGTDLQIANGTEGDTVESFVQDTLAGGDNEGDPALVQVMGDNALDAYNWLVNDIHVEFMPDRVQQFGGHSVPRAVVPVGNKGTEIINKLAAAAEEKGVQIFMNTEATELIVDESGAVVGVKAENNGKTVTYHANKGVVLASGGFGANVEMREQYNTDYGRKYMTTCTPASTGDGIRMAEAVGADLTQMDYIQVYPTCNPDTGIISYVANSRFDGAILVGKEGKRFTDEMGRRDVISNGILAQTDEVAYLVWGQEIETVGNMTQMHTAEYEDMVKTGVLHKVDSLEEAAAAFGIDEAAFLETISTYNGYCDAGSDPDFNKGGALKKIEQGPFYIQKTTPSTHHTMGGVKINTDAQVLKADGNIVDNLYAAGEVTGGIHATNRLGGNAITDIIVFGRIAGRNVAK